MFPHNISGNPTNNPYRCQIQERINALICYDNDYRRISVEIKKAEENHKLELERIIFSCSMKQKMGCSPEFQQQQKNLKTDIQTVDKMKETFEKRIRMLTKERQDVFDASRKCFQEMQNLKIQNQRYHMNSINDLKKMVLEAGDTTTRNNYEKDIQELNKLWIKDMLYIERCESVLKPFLDLLSNNGGGEPKAHCNLKDWTKSFQEVVKIEENIKSAMGSVLTKLLAMIHLYQPSDVKTFAANYLMHLKHIDDIVKNKLETIECTKID
ncbi:uncharacterized protein LOC133331652 [Musca vetustissima]|uniref:uncharacterized protein LOC133331652 n=1 Tax=Musca vetustissima TaxID=27455 RepID=UPI002AB7E566|nr:uncharacterized protein LOC133331652 [Musca vetustissima]